MTKLIISLDEAEFEALRNVAWQEMRSSKDQARYILRSVLLDVSIPTNGKSTVPQTWQRENSAFAGSNL